MFSRWTNTKLVLCEDSEDVLLELDQTHGFVGGLFDGGGQTVPDLAVGSSALDNVVGDSGAAVIPRRVPGQEAGLIGDLRDVEGSWRTRLICVWEEYFKFNYPEKVSLKTFFVPFIFSFVKWSYRGC